MGRQLRSLSNLIEVYIQRLRRKVDDGTDEELEAVRDTLAYVVPIALLLAGLGGWFLAHRSLAPVVAMAEHARRIGGEDSSGRLPVAIP